MSSAFLQLGTLSSDDESDTEYNVNAKNSTKKGKNKQEKQIRQELRTLAYSVPTNNIKKKKKKKSKAKQTIKSESGQDVAQTGLQQDVARSDKQQNAAQIGLQQDVARSDEQQAVAEPDQQQAVAGSDKQQDVAQSDKQQDVAQSDKQQDVAQSDKQVDVSSKKNQISAKMNQSHTMINQPLSKPNDAASTTTKPTQPQQTYNQSSTHKNVTQENVFSVHSSMNQHKNRNRHANFIKSTSKIPTADFSDHPSFSRQNTTANTSKWMPLSTTESKHMSSTVQNVAKECLDHVQHLQTKVPSVLPSPFLNALKHLASPSNTKSKTTGVSNHRLITADGSCIDALSTTTATTSTSTSTTNRSDSTSSQQTMIQFNEKDFISYVQFILKLQIHTENQKQELSTAKLQNQELNHAMEAMVETDSSTHVALENAKLKRLVTEIGGQLKMKHHENKIQTEQINWLRQQIAQMTHKHDPSITQANTRAGSNLKTNDTSIWNRNTGVSHRNPTKSSSYSLNSNKQKQQVMNRNTSKTTLTRTSTNATTTRNVWTKTPVITPNTTSSTHSTGSTSFTSSRNGKTAENPRTRESNVSDDSRSGSRYIPPQRRGNTAESAFNTGEQKSEDTKNNVPSSAPPGF